MADLPPEALDDPFRPPALPTEVGCLHCGREYESYLIVWREFTDREGAVHGFWCCPTPGCDGKGFGFDIWPTDPDYINEDGEPMGWNDDGDDCDDDEEWDEEDDPEIAAAVEMDLAIFEENLADEEPLPGGDEALPWDEPDHEEEQRRRRRDEWW